MRLAFYKGSGRSIIEHAIKARTNSDYCHVELLFSDGETFSSDLTSGGVRYTDGGSIRTQPDLWQLVDIGLMDERALREACDVHVGEKYDVLGCVAYLFNAAAGSEEAKLHRYFCSSICALMLQTQHRFTFLVPTATSPEVLRIASLARYEALAA